MGQITKSVVESTTKVIHDSAPREEEKNTSPSALKRLIKAELENTTVTVVLIGSDTWARRWVHYEIFKSIKRGNHVLGIHINFDSWIA
ncbi:MAG: TIR domain-containing protein [Candidatus Acidiferrales bacterium]